MCEETKPNQDTCGTVIRVWTYPIKSQLWGPLDLREFRHLKCDENEETRHYPIANIPQNDDAGWSLAIPNLSSNVKNPRLDACSTLAMARVRVLQSHVAKKNSCNAKKLTTRVDSTGICSMYLSSIRWPCS